MAVVQGEQQVAVAARVVGLGGQGFAVAGFGLGVAALGLQGDSQVSEAAVAFAQGGQSGAVVLFGLDRAPGLAEQGAEGFVRLRVAGSDGQRVAEKGWIAGEQAVGQGHGAGHVAADEQAAQAGGVAFPPFVP